MNPARVRRGIRFDPSARWIAIVLGALLGVVTAVAPMLGVALMVGTVLVGLFAWNPVVGLATLIMSRSSLDWFQDPTRRDTGLDFNPAASLGILMIGLALVFVGFRIRNRQPIDWGGRAGLAWGGWVAFSILAVPVALLQLGGTVFAAAVREYVRLMSVLAVYLLVVNLARDRTSRQIMVLAILLGALIPTAAGIAQIFTDDPTHKIDGVRRIQGTFIHPGGLGLYLVAIVMVLLGLWQDAWGGKRGRFWIGFSAVCAVTLMILTYTRAALGIFLLALFLWGWRGTRRQKTIMLGSMAAFVLALAPLLAWRFMDLVAGGDPSAERTNSFIWRLFNFRNLLGKFTESPIVGFGLRSTGFVNPTRMTTEQGMEGGFAPHSEVVRVLVEQGAIGLIFYVVMVVMLLKAIKRLSMRRTETGAPIEFAGLARAIYCLLLSTFLLAPLGADVITATAFFYVIFAAIGVAYTSDLSSGFPRASSTDDGKRTVSTLG